MRVVEFRLRSRSTRLEIAALVTMELCLVSVWRHPTARRKTLWSVPTRRPFRSCRVTLFRRDPPTSQCLLSAHQLHPTTPQASEKTLYTIQFAADQLAAAQLTQCLRRGTIETSDCRVAAHCSRANE